MSELTVKQEVYNHLIRDYRKASTFRAVNIVDKIGCDRKRLHTILMDLVDRGALVKNDRTYMVNNTETITQLLLASAKSGKEKYFRVTDSRFTQNLESLDYFYTYTFPFMVEGSGSPNGSFETFDTILMELDSSLKSIQHLRRTVERAKGYETSRLCENKTVSKQLAANQGMYKNMAKNAYEIIVERDLTDYSDKLKLQVEDLQNTWKTVWYSLREKMGYEAKKPSGREEIDE